MKVPLPAENTSEKILDAAEALFIERGFSATSLRAIATLAEVNLAAAHYHFGSKSGLLEAAVHRRVSRLNQRRIELLDELEATNAHYSLEQLMGVFFAPMVEVAASDGFGKLMGRLFGEPIKLVRPILEKEFGVVARRFIHALHVVMPHISLEEVQWRFHFSVGAMSHLLNIDEPIGVNPSSLTIKAKIEKLQAYVVAGIRQSPEVNTVVQSEVSHA